MKRPCPIQPEHVLESFDCGVPALNVFLKDYALLNEKNGSARTYVVLDEQQVIGFYSIASGAISHSEAPERLKKGLSRQPVPIILLGRFAVDRRYQGQGLGYKLFADAMRQALKVSEKVGVRAVVIDAKDAQGRYFYQRLGFLCFDEPQYANRLYCLVKDIRKTFASL